MPRLAHERTRAQALQMAREFRRTLPTPKNWKPRAWKNGDCWHFECVNGDIRARYDVLGSNLGRTTRKIWFVVQVMLPGTEHIRWAASKQSLEATFKAVQEQSRQAYCEVSAQHMAVMLALAR